MNLMNFPPRSRTVVGNREVHVPEYQLPTVMKFLRRERGPISTKKELAWAAYWDSKDGYGFSSQVVVEELMRRGWEIAPHWVENKSSIHKCENPEIRVLAGRQDLSPEIGVAYLLPPDIYILPPTKRIILNVLWETTQLPAAWTDFINIADALVVPTDFCMDVVRGTGTKLPIFKIPVAVDLPRYPLIERKHWKDTETFNVLFLSAPYERKGIDCAINIFKGAFPDDPDARFRMHIRSATPVSQGSKDRIRDWVGDDSRITISWDSLPQEEIVKLYHESHLLLHPARG